MSRCPCRSARVFQHKKYKTTNAAVKNIEYNATAAHEVMKVYHPGDLVTVIDAREGHTTRAMVNIGVDPKNILAFTHCALDYDGMCNSLGDLIARGVKCRLDDAAAIYAGSRFGTDNPSHIVLDDGTEYAHKVIPRVHILLSRPIWNLACSFNIVPRCGNCKDMNGNNCHNRFAEEVAAAARYYGWIVHTATMINSYRQGSGPGQSMWMFWFVFSRPRIAAAEISQ